MIGLHWYYLLAITKSIRKIISNITLFYGQFIKFGYPWLTTCLVGRRNIKEKKKLWKLTREKSFKNFPVVPIYYPFDRHRLKLNVNKTFRKSGRQILNTLCKLNLCRVFRGRGGRGNNTIQRMKFVFKNLFCKCERISINIIYQIKSLSLSLFVHLCKLYTLFQTLCQRY